MTPRTFVDEANGFPPPSGSRARRGSAVGFAAVLTMPNTGVRALYAGCVPPGLSGAAVRRCKKRDVPDTRSLCYLAERAHAKLVGDSERRRHAMGTDTPALVTPG